MLVENKLETRLKLSHYYQFNSQMIVARGNYRYAAFTLGRNAGCSNLHYDSIAIIYDRVAAFASEV